jgi:hypothetical protein
MIEDWFQTSSIRRIILNTWEGFRSSSYWKTIRNTNTWHTGSTHYVERILSSWRKAKLMKRRAFCC